MRLRAIPHHPTNAQLEAAYDGAAKVSGLTLDAVKAAARPYLLKRGLVHPGGRPRAAARHQIVVALMTERELMPSDSMPRGFWPDAYEAVVVAGEQGRLTSYEALCQWWHEHKVVCFQCTTAPTNATEP